MEINNSKYELTAVKPEQYPLGIMPEVALIGRSNAGKSSIINALLNRRNLARVAAAPGKTREINFYNIDSQLYFVDLPGYGYASVSKDKKASWGTVVETYLYSRAPLKLLIMLVDIRHTPSSDDKLMYDWILSHGVPHIVVATKADKIPRSRIHSRLQDIKEFLGTIEGATPIAFSSETKLGRDELWAQINKRLNI